MSDYLTNLAAAATSLAHGSAPIWLPIAVVAALVGGARAIKRWDARMQAEVDAALSTDGLHRLDAALAPDLGDAEWARLQAACTDDPEVRAIFLAAAERYEREAA